MTKYEFTMEHSAGSFEALAHMQYDLFCRVNRVARFLVGIGAGLIGVMNMSVWWGMLLLVYGGYMLSGRYSSANHTARKLSRQLEESGAPYPRTRFLFHEQAVEILDLNDPSAPQVFLKYAEVQAVGEDYRYFYLFRDRYGGYMLPKEQLGEREERFRMDLVERCGRSVQSSSAPALRLLRWFLTRREKKKRDGSL